MTSMPTLSTAKLRSQTGGIVIRQAINPSATDLTASPDLIVTGTSEAFDPSTFVDPEAYEWYFSQAPVIGSGNYVYIRGVNYTPSGTQNSTVYLYCVENDRLLDPTNWSSAGFAVNGVNQNHVPISAVSEYQYVTAQSPVRWTPPSPATAGATNILISWVDNSATPSPPSFPATPFATMADFTAYLKQNPQMAVLDTIYRGAFLRQFPGQTAAQDSTGAQTCPDIIVTGNSAAPDASWFAAASSYSPGTLSQKAGLGARNFIYVRALNTRNGPGTSRVYLYWTTTNDISPPSWQATDLTYAGKVQNWVDLAASTANQVMVSTVPLIWQPPVPPRGISYVLIAYVDNTASPQPPDFTPFGYVNPSAVAGFVARQPQLSWLAVTGGAAPQATMSWNASVSSSTGGSFYVGVQLSGIPTDGSFSLSIPGPDAADTIVAPSVRVPNPNALVAWRVTYPERFATSAVLSYTQGPTAPPSGANITSVLVPWPAR
jgi:hypothetical protein